MEQPLAVNAENSRAKVQNVGGDSSGVCQSCKQPLCRESAMYCAKHLAMKRKNQRKRLGTVVHGRGQHPNTLAALRKAAETRKPKHISRTKQNSALLKMMRGEETSEE